MVIDLDKYRLSFPAIKHYLSEKDPGTHESFIGALAIMTHVPIIAVAHYVGEIYGHTGKLNDFIKRLMLFYKVDEVIGTK